MKTSALLGLATLLSSAQAYDNPILWNDLADNDISRVDDTYYYSASSMHFSPGAPILRSKDLVNWEYIAHSVPSLDFGTKYDLTDARAYNNGIWASFMRYHASQDTWYWGGCIDFTKTYIYTAPDVTGKWSQRACYYDSGLLIDDDDTMYVSYAADDAVWVAQLSSNGTSEVSSQQVYVPSEDIGYLEGTRMYKHDGRYYILTTRPARGTHILMADEPFGTYTLKELVLNVKLEGSDAGPVHQGSLVDTPDGDWYYMGFVDAYPDGRIPVLVPITWGSDGFPTAELVDGAVSASYGDPVAQVAVPALTGTDTFKELGPRWEWNHNPDTSAYSVGDGLTLGTVTVTDDLYSARNTLTQRTLGPDSTATIELNYAGMADGDRAGLAILRDQSAWVGVKKDSGKFSVNMVDDITMDASWDTNSTGTTVESASISGGTVWLRVYADVMPGGSNTARFSYSTDGTSFTGIGEDFTMGTSWEFYMGYRFGIFNYATTDLGGSVTVASFTLDAGEV
ncbi:glycosyl hydrolase [Schizophyllum amplum]|uniref:Glycosyl hydrolase n=1 Tax=Schizophyllum amplum TaxID=97359 RepID=A0A550CL57_9AGAR|nr:glycosyl hydrolase [Auriculariopsis ampla]